MFVVSKSTLTGWIAPLSLALASIHAAAQPATPPPQPAPRVFAFSTGVGYLGINVKEVDATRARELKLKEEAGVEVTTIEPDSPAAKSGLTPGDVVVEFNNQHVEGTAQFIRLVRETPVGREVRMKVFRSGSAQTLTARVGERKAPFGFSEKDRERLERDLREQMSRQRIQVLDTPRPFVGWRSGMLGIEGEELKGQLAEYFGVKEGVLVRSVAKDMPAAKAGLKAGDVVIKVEDSKVTSPRELTSAIRSSKGKGPLKLSVVRQKAEITLEAAIEEEREVQRGVTVGNPQNYE